MGYTARANLPGIFGVLKDWDLQNGGGGISQIKFFYIPDTVSENWSAEWQKISIIGRSAPLWGYSNTGARTVSLNLTFFAENDAQREVHDKVRWIQTFLLPDYSKKFMVRPHRLQLVLGNFINIVGVLESCPITWKAPYMSMGRTASPDYPVMADVALSIAETVDTPFGAAGWRSRPGATLNPSQES